MKTLKERIITSFLFAVLASTSHLLAQDEYNQVTGYRLQGLSREQGTGNREQVPNNRESESLLEDQIEQRTEITANCNNASHCYLMMNPAMVGETEEAIEKFIIGEAGAPLSASGKHSVNSSVECALINNEGSSDSACSSKSPSPAAAAASPSSHLSPPTTIRPISRIVTASVLGLGAFCSLLPQTMAQPTGQPTSWPTSQPTSAANEAFVVYSGLSDESIYPKSITTNIDGSYIIGGYVYPPSAVWNSLLGKLNFNGQEEWFYEQSTPGASISVDSTTIMNNELYSGGLLGIEGPNGYIYGYIGRNNLTSGDLLSAWGIVYEYGTGTVYSILPTKQNTLVAFGGNYGLEFDPYSGTVLSGVMFPNNDILSAAAINDSSYAVGSAGGCLSQISFIGTNWNSDWTRCYLGAYIDSVAARNNTVVFAGSMNRNGFIGSVDATTGATNWLTSIGSINYSGANLGSVVFASSDLNNTDQIMAVGYIKSAAWYLLMNLNNGTLSKSVILEGVGETQAISVVANDDGTFTSVGQTAYGDSAENLMFITLNENLEINSNLLPLGFSCSDNSDNITTNAQNITSTASSLNFSSYSFIVINNVVSVVNDPITAVWEGGTAQPTVHPTAQPTKQPSSQPTNPTGQPTDQPPAGSSKGNNNSSIIIGGSVGGAAIICTLICACRKMMGDYLKEKPRRSSLFDGDVEQSFVLPRPFGSFSREAAISSSTVQAPSILSDNNISIEEAADIKDRPSDVVTDQPPAQYTEQVSPMH